jgi:hypothetical protein
MGANFWIGQISAVRTDCRLTTDGADGHGYKRCLYPYHNIGESRISNNIPRTASQTIGMFNRRWRRLTQIRDLSPRTMGLGFEPSVILGIGFIQIESVKSVVKKSGVGFGCGSGAPGRSV